MALRKATPIIGSLAVLGVLLSTGVRADDYDKKTTVTFSVPVAIPPVHLQGWGVLPPGTYVFKLLNSSSNRHIVQIFNQDQTQIYATILAIPNYRLQAKDKTVMTFNEGIGGKPESLRAWFYPGSNWGEEFVYPKEQAVVLAKATNVPVLQTTAIVPVEVPKPDAPAVIAELERVPVTAVRPTGQTVELAQVVTPPPATVVTAQAKAPTQSPAPAAAQAPPAVAQVPAQSQLPETASFLPLIALFGLLALGGAVGVRAYARKIR